MGIHLIFRFIRESFLKTVFPSRDGFQSIRLKKKLLKEFNVNYSELLFGRICLKKKKRMGTR